MAYREDKAIRYGKRGSSDILGLTSDGKLLCIEIKTGRATQSQHQVAFHNTVEKFGGRYLLARSASQVIAYLDNLNLPKISLA
jgi:hypothetical protein